MFAESPDLIFIMSPNGVIDYGRCFLLIEMLGRYSNALDLKNDMHLFAIKSKLELFDQDDLEKFLERLKQTSLFCVDENTLSSPVISDMLMRIGEISETRRSAAEKKHEKYKELHKPLQKDANLCKVVQTPANVCKPLQKDANDSKNIQTTANECNNEQTSANNPILIIKPIRKPITKTENEETAPLPPKGENVSTPKKPSAKKDTVTVKQLVERYHELFPNLKPVIILDEKTKACANARLEEHGAEKIELMFQAALKSSHLHGENDRGWQATFAWMMLPTNFAKIVNGTYIKSDTPARVKPDAYNQRLNFIMDSIAEDREKKERSTLEDEQRGNEGNVWDNRDHGPEGQICDGQEDL